MARAIVVIGVVFNHSVDGFITAGLVDESSVIAQVNSVLYVFRMPALAFLLGTFIPDGVAKFGSLIYLRRRLSVLLYLYCVWFLIQGVVEIVASDLKNHPREWSSLASPWLPFAHLWFLLFIAYSTVAVVVIAPWRSLRRGVIALAGSLVVSVLTWGWDHELLGANGLALGLFVCLGAALGFSRLRSLLRLGAMVWGVVAAVTLPLTVLLAGASVPATRLTGVNAGQSIVSIICALSGLTLSLAAAVLMSYCGPVRGVLASIGRQTLPIYLAHVAIVGGIRVVVVEFRLLESSSGAAITLATALGVLLPYVMGRLAGSGSILHFLFGLPRGPVRGARKAMRGVGVASMEAPRSVGR